MIGTGGALTFLDRMQGMGLTKVNAELDFQALKERIGSIEARLEHSVRGLLESQGVQIVQGTGRMVGPNEVVADTVDGELHFEADAILVSTGSRPRIPEWAPVD